MSRGKVSANREMEAGEELAGTLGGSPVRALRWVFLIAAVIALLALGSRLLQDRKYNLISVLIVLAACFAFYFTYEKREDGAAGCDDGYFRDRALHLWACSFF